MLSDGQLDPFTTDSIAVRQQQAEEKYEEESWPADGEEKGIVQLSKGMFHPTHC